MAEHPEPDFYLWAQSFHPVSFRGSSRPPRCKLGPSASVSDSPIFRRVANPLINVPVTPSNIELRFHEEMLDTYRRAKVDCPYNANYFHQMVRGAGGLQAARTLLAGFKLSDGFTTLWQFGRLDLTVEALVLKSPWRDLFTDDVLAVAQKRLDDLGYVPR